MPNGFEALELLGELEAERVAGGDGVDPLAGDEVLGGERGGGVGDERLAERVDAVAGDGQAGGGAVAAVAEQLVGAGGEAGEEVEARDRAAGAGALVAVERDQDRRAVVALGDAGGDDPDHARVPALGGEHVRGRAGRALLGQQRLGLEADAGLDVAALGVDRVELQRDLAGPLGVGGEQELEAGVGAVEAPGGVEPWREAEADRALVDAAGVHPRDVHQRLQPGLAGAGERGGGPARTRRRFSPVSETTSATVASATRSRSSSTSARVLPRAGHQRLGELVGDAGRAQVRARVAADPRVHDRGVGQRAVGARRVVVGDHDVHAPRRARRRPRRPR